MIPCDILNKVMQVNKSTLGDGRFIYGINYNFTAQGSRFNYWIPTALNSKLIGIHARYTPEIPSKSEFCVCTAGYCTKILLAGNRSVFKHVAAYVVSFCDAFLIR